MKDTPPFYQEVRERIAMINGKEVPYDVCSGSKTLEESQKFYGKKARYVGHGYIHSINGRVQKPANDENHFFVWRGEKNDK